MRWILRKRFVSKGGADANEQAQENFYNTMTSNYNTDFNQFEDAMTSFQSKLKPIIDAGPGQYGFDPTEDSSIRGQAINNDASTAQNAEQAVNQQIKASNGGADLMPTGAQEQLHEEGDVAAAQKLSTDQNTITQAGYEAGRQNYQGALGAEEGALGMMNPNAFAGAANGAGSNATSAVNSAVASDNSWMSLVGGALGGATSAFTSWGMGKAGK